MYQKTSARQSTGGFSRSPPVLVLAGFNNQEASLSPTRSHVPSQGAVRKIYANMHTCIIIMKGRLHLWGVEPCCPGRRYGRYLTTMNDLISLDVTLIRSGSALSDLARDYPPSFDLPKLRGTVFLRKRSRADHKAPKRINFYELAGGLKPFSSRGKRYKSSTVNRHHSHSEPLNIDFY